MVQLLWLAICAKLVAAAFRFHLDDRQIIHSITDGLGAVYYRVSDDGRAISENGVTVLYKSSCGHKKCLNSTAHAVCFGTHCFLSNKDGDFGLEAMQVLHRARTMEQHLSIRRWNSRYTKEDYIVTIPEGQCPYEGKKITLPQYEKIPPKPYKFGIIFLVTDGFVKNDMWYGWIENAIDWSKQMFLTKEGPYKFLKNNPDLVETYKSDPSLISVKMHIGAPEKANRQILHPFILKNIIPTMPNGWGKINGVLAALYREIMKDPHVIGTAVVTGSDIPLRPFSHIYNNFSQNPRSRIEFWPYAMPMFFKKHYQWMVLNRPHAMALSGNEFLWNCNAWLHVQPKTAQEERIAGPDEYLPYQALEFIFGATSIQRQINSGKIFSRQPLSQAWQLEENPHIETKYYHTFSAWERSICDLVGDCNVRCCGSAEFTILNYERLLDYITKHPEVWFLRKVTSKTVLRKDNGQDIPLNGMIIDLSDEFNGTDIDWKTIFS